MLCQMLLATNLTLARNLMQSSSVSPFECQVTECNYCWLYPQRTLACINYTVTTTDPVTIDCTVLVIQIVEHKLTKEFFVVIYFKVLKIPNQPTFIIRM